MDYRGYLSDSLSAKADVVVSNTGDSEEHAMRERRSGGERRVVDKGAPQNLWHGYHEDAERRAYSDRRRGSGKIVQAFTSEGYGEGSVTGIPVSGEAAGGAGEAIEEGFFEGPPPGEKGDCPAEGAAPGGRTYYCTLDAGHKGEHVAHLTDDRAVAKWPTTAPNPRTPTTAQPTEAAPVHEIEAMVRERSAVTHAVERTSPLGESFIGVCRLCGAIGLTSADALKPCPNPGRLTRDEALLDAIAGDAAPSTLDVGGERDAIAYEINATFHADDPMMLDDCDE
jgi:hypothetical protein